MLWNIYHLEYEFAKKAGDPILAEIEAETRDEAIAKGCGLNLSAPTGIWAVPKEWCFLRNA